MPTMNYCNQCGGTLEFKQPDNDNRKRYVCSVCGMIHYQNPRLIVGTIPVFGDQVLLCQRAIEPQYSKWTLPAGFYENGESVEEGALRETQEEAHANVILERMFSVISVPHIGQVHMMFLARLPHPEFGPGDESLAVRLFDEADIPWDTLAFRTVSRALRCFFDDRRRGLQRLHVSTMFRATEDRKRDTAIQCGASRQ